MTEVQALFLILGAIYLLQCVVWLPSDCVAFRSGLRGRWKLAGEGLSLEALQLKAIVVNPLPPLPGVIACQPTTLFVSPQGLAALPPKSGVLQPQLEFVSFNAISSIRTNEKILLLNDLPFAAFHSPATVRSTAALLGKLSKTNESKRGQIISAEVQERFDSQAIAARLAQGKEAASLLRFSCNLLFALLFMVAPLIVWRNSLAASWPYLLAALIGYIAIITWEFVRAHKALYPDGKDQRFTDALTVALSPAGAVRANDLLLKDLLRQFHPVAVAQALCRPPQFEVFASQTLRELTFPRAAEASPEAEQTRLWWLAAELSALRSFLLKRGIDTAQWLAAPEKEPECASFCPRCWSQFVQREGTCPECGDLALRPFAENTVGAVVSAS
ncbi:MAG: hypothetical protein L0Z53_05235 [Acidobacteriales bacterium]|nr:hypothetical protein [Terriglobales bacterium]